MANGKPVIIRVTCEFVEKAIELANVSKDNQIYMWKHLFEQSSTGEPYVDDGLFRDPVGQSQALNSLGVLAKQERKARDVQAASELRERSRDADAEASLIAQRAEPWANRPKKVYIIAATKPGESNDLFKIGISENPPLRMGQIQSNSDYSLVLLRAYETPHWAHVEAAAHKILDRFRLSRQEGLEIQGRGGSTEWFKVKEDIVVWVVGRLAEAENVDKVNRLMTTLKIEGFEQVAA